MIIKSLIRINLDKNKYVTQLIYHSNSNVSTTTTTTKNTTILMPNIINTPSQLNNIDDKYNPCSL